MDVGYWIFILIAYLVSQWLRRRAQSFRQPPPQEQPAEQPVAPPPEKKQKETVPQFLRNLGIDELFEEIKSEFQPEETYEEVEEETAELDDDFEIPDDETFIEPEPQPAMEDVPAEPTFPERAAPSKYSVGVTAESRPIHAYFKSGADLRNVILMKEILGPPRAIERHRFRRYF